MDAGESKGNDGEIFSVTVPSGSRRARERGRWSQAKTVLIRFIGGKYNASIQKSLSLPFGDSPNPPDRAPPLTLRMAPCCSFQTLTKSSQRSVPVTHHPVNSDHSLRPKPMPAISSGAELQSEPRNPPGAADLSAGGPGMSAHSWVNGVKTSDTIPGVNQVMYEGCGRTMPRLVSVFSLAISIDEANPHQLSLTPDSPVEESLRHPRIHMFQRRWPRSWTLNPPGYRSAGFVSSQRGIRSPHQLVPAPFLQYGRFPRSPTQIPA